jgi:hypothetical protein
MRSKLVDLCLFLSSWFINRAESLLEYNKEIYRIPKDILESMEANQPPELRERIMATRKANLEAWEKIGITD